MRVPKPGFQPERLTEARDARGLSQVGLAELIDKTSTSISRWESGSQSPEADAIEDLARALNVPNAFFLRPTPSHGIAPLFFRSMASITKTGRKRAKARLRWAQDISSTLQEYVDLPDVNLPHLDFTDHKKISDEEIEFMANECRRVWKLGDGPVSDVLLAIENAGIVVVKEEVGSVAMDGLSNWSFSDNRPYIFLSKDKASSVRSRLDAAHELGHLVLHHKINEETLKSASDFKEIERQAFLFAGAFLLPAESFSSEVWAPSLGSLSILKQRWKTSIGMMIKRCSNLGLIDENYTTQLWKYYSAKGWRKSEPLDDVLEPEVPRLLARSIKLLIDSNIKTRRQLLDDFRLNSSDAESLASLPRGYLSEVSAEIIHFPKLRIVET